MALSAIVHRLFVFAGRNEGDASLALGRAGVADARDCSSVITSALQYLESYQNAARPDIFGLSGLKPFRRSRISTTSSCPRTAAQESGIWPPLSGLSR